MFVFITVSPKEKQVNDGEPIICPSCGRMGRAVVFVQSQVFCLFFIPLFSFSKKYTARTTCCHRAFSLTKENGQRIEKGDVRLQAEDLIRTGYTNDNCTQCGETISPNFRYCPHCGHPKEE